MRGVRVLLRLRGDRRDFDAIRDEETAVKADAKCTDKVAVVGALSRISLCQEV